jgi:hypothetical protein
MRWNGSGRIAYSEVILWKDYILYTRPRNPLFFLRWVLLGLWFFGILLFLNVFHDFGVKEMVHSFFGSHVTRVFELSGGFRHEKLR